VVFAKLVIQTALLAEMLVPETVITVNATTVMWL